MKQWGWGYGVWIIVLFILIRYSSYLYEYLRHHTAITYNPWYGIVGSYSMYLGVGFLLGSDHMVRAVLGQGHWRVNWPKLLWGSITCLFLIILFISPLLGLKPPWVGATVWNRVYSFLIYPGPFCYASGLLLGNVLVTSFYREAE